MADERDEDQFGENEGKAGQQPTGQQGQQNPTAERGQEPMGQQGQSSGGQAQQSETMTGDSSGQNKSGQSGSQGEGFVGSQGSGSDEYLQERGGQSGDDAAGGTDFAEKGQGAPEAEEDDTGGSSL